MATFRELLQAAKGRVRETDPAGAEALLAEGHLLLDVREPDEYEQGAIPGSIHIPRATSSPASRTGSPTATSRSS